MRNFLLLILLSLQAFAASPADEPLAAGAPDREVLSKARQLFYASVENKSKIEPAIAAFNELIRQRPDWEGRARTYVGALVALKGKHSFWPHDKWRWANRGLKIMDQGVAESPEDVEALFIHSSTCYFLPFFFKRGDDAQAKFRELVRLLPEKHGEFDSQMLKNVLQFISERAHLMPEERAVLDQLKIEAQFGES